MCKQHPCLHLSCLVFPVPRYPCIMKNKRSRGKIIKNKWFSSFLEGCWPPLQMCAESKGSGGYFFLVLSQITLSTEYSGCIADFFGLVSRIISFFIGVFWWRGVGFLSNSNKMIFFVENALVGYCNCICQWPRIKKTAARIHHKTNNYNALQLIFFSGHKNMKYFIS